jgi:hypothetical protein
MALAMGKTSEPSGAELPAAAYPYHHRVFASATAAAATGVLFDSKTFTVMAIAQPANSEMPILIVVDGDLSLQIGETRFRLGAGDAVQIPRGARFGKSRSGTGSRLLLIRGKAMRSFSVYR